jgi:hypothetical protein
MTQYLLAVHSIEGEAEPSGDDVQALYAAVDVFNKSVMDAGKWVFAGGLHPADTATVVDARSGETIITDGPFAEAKEQLGGFWVIEAVDLDEALRLAAQASAACQNPVEVRPFQGE